MAAKTKRPEVVQLTTEELEQLLTDVRGLLPPATYHLIESLLRTLVWIMGLLEQKQTTIARLRRLIFGEKSEKARKLSGRGCRPGAQTQAQRSWPQRGKPQPNSNEAQPQTFFLQSLGIGH